MVLVLACKCCCTSDQNDDCLCMLHTVVLALTKHRLTCSLLTECEPSCGNCCMLDMCNVVAEVAELLLEMAVLAE